MEHKDIPDAQRHEPRGASTATSGEVLVSTGSGATEFRFLTAADLQGGVPLSGYSLKLNGSSTSATQNPSAVDTPLQVNFGVAQTTTDVSLSDTGTLTFNTAGKYLLTVFLRFGRTSGTGTAVVLNRLLIDGVQVLKTNAIALTDVAATIPFSATLLFDVAAGQTFKMQIARDSAGVNNGGLTSTPVTTLPWQPVPSASIAVYKLGT